MRDKLDSSHKVNKMTVVMCREPRSVLVCQCATAPTICCCWWHSVQPSVPHSPHWPPHIWHPLALYTYRFIIFNVNSFWLVPLWNTIPHSPRHTQLSPLLHSSIIQLILFEIVVWLIRAPLIPKQGRSGWQVGKLNFSPTAYWPWDSQEGRWRCQKSPFTTMATLLSLSLTSTCDVLILELLLKWKYLFWHETQRNVGKC